MTRGMRIGFPRDVRVSADSGTYGITGNAAGTNKGYAVQAAQGNYALAGGDAVLTPAGSSTPSFLASGVPNVNFPPGVASTFPLTPYTTGFDPVLHKFQLLTGTLPSGVTLNQSTGLTYDGIGGISSTSGVSFHIADVISAADADFLARSTAPGVFRSFSFNSSADLGGSFGANFGTVPGTGAVSLDTTVKASGVSSLKFDIIAGGDGTHGFSGGCSTNWFTNFHTDLQRYGENTQFYFQFKVRIGQTVFDDYSHKFFLCGSGDDGTNVFASCTDLEIEMEHYAQSHGFNATNKFPIMYNACPGSCGGVFPFFETLSGGLDFDLQPDTGPSTCLFSGPTQSGCAYFVPEQWMVFQVGVTVGPRVTSGGNFWFQGSRIKMWMQTSPGATEQLVIDFITNSMVGSQIGLCAGHGATGNQAYGKLWLLPYTQNSVGAGARAGNVWYDELILSEQKIPAAQA